MQWEERLTCLVGVWGAIEWNWQPLEFEVEIQDTQSLADVLAGAARACCFKLTWTPFQLHLKKTLKRQCCTMLWVCQFEFLVRATTPLLLLHRSSRWEQLRWNDNDINLCVDSFCLNDIESSETWGVCLKANFLQADKIWGYIMWWQPQYNYVEFPLGLAPGVKQTSGNVETLETHSFGELSFPQC